MRKKILLYGLCILMGCSLLGCGREKVEYGQDDVVQSSSDVVNSEGNIYTEGIAKSINAEEKIQDQIESNDGETLSVYGDVIVPDVKSLNVYRTTKQELDTKYIKQLMDAYSDDGKIYSGAEEDLPKSALILSISRYENYIKQAENALSEGIFEESEYYQYKADYEEKLDYYRNLYQLAGDNYKQITYDEWNKDDRIVVFHEENPYFVSVSDYNIECIIECMAVDYINIIPDLPTDAKAVEVSDLGLWRDVEAEDLEKIANASETFSKSLGVGKFSIIDENDIIHPQFAILCEDNKVEEMKYGYYVRLGRELDGVKVDSSRYNGVPIYNDGDNPMVSDETEEQTICRYKPMENMNVLFDEDFGVIGFRYESPLCLPEVERANVSILPYESVKSALLESLAVQPVINGGQCISDENGFIAYVDVYKFYTDLELLYFRMENPDKKGEYLIIPAWRLGVSGDQYGDNACLLNAIDGSRIDLRNETLEWIAVDEEQ